LYFGALWLLKYILLVANYLLADDLRSEHITRYDTNLYFPLSEKHTIRI